MPRICWICSECAKSKGGYWPEGHVGTFHDGKCDVCEREKLVTEPRDYRLSSTDAGELYRRRECTIEELYLYMMDNPLIGEC